MSFRVATRITAAAIILVGDLHDDDRAGGLGLRIVRIGVGDDHAGTLGFAQADVLRLHYLFSPFASVVGRTQHDHAVSENKLRMVHDIAIGVDGMLAEAESLA